MGSRVAGLREKKRVQTQDRILENAIALFRRHGVRATRLARVAEASDVSTGTLYNYFPTKGDLAAAWLRREIRQALAKEMERDAAGDRPLRQVLRRVVARLARAAAAEPALREEAWHEAGRAPAEPASNWPEWVVCLKREQEHEHVRQDLSAESLAEIIVDALEGGLIAGLRQPAERDVRAPSESSIEGAIRARLDLALDGARKRNERVRAPAPPA